MKRLLVVLAAGLIWVPGAQGAATLDPGDKLTVACAGKKAMRGLPFTRPNGEAVARVAHRERFHFFGSFNADRTAFLALVQVRKRIGHRHFTMLVGGTESVRWRGC